MTGLTIEPLQKAIYTALSGDAALDAIITGIYDRVPERTAYPYLQFADTRAEDLSAQGITADRVTMTLHSWSRGGGRKQTADIVERVHTVLHEASLALEGGFTLVLLRVSDIRVEQQSDGITWQGIMTLEAVVSE